MRRLKHVTAMRAGGTPPVADPSMWAEDGVPWVTISDMTRSSTVTDTERRVSVLGVKAKNLTIGAPGTILFAMYASVGALGVLQTRATWNQAILGIEPIHDLAEPRFVFYWLRYMHQNLELLFRSNTQDNLNAEQVANIPFSAIPLQEQRAIADFLDIETARIDALIAKKGQVVDLLTKKGSSRISRSLWLDGTYDPIRLRHLTGRPTSGNRDHGAFVFANTGVPCLRGLNIKPARIDRQNLLYIDEATNDVHSNTILKSGDLAIVRSGFAGAAALVPPDLDGCNCVDLVLVRKCSTLMPSYLEYVVNSKEAQEQVRQKSSGALLSHFNAVDAGDLIIPYRELAQQQEIVAELDWACSKIDRTMDLIQGQIILLQEHRQALITAAVTGEMDVPGVSR